MRRGNASGKLPEAAKHLQAAREETARVAEQLRVELGRTWRMQFKNALQWQTIAEMLRQYGGPSGNSFAMPSESEYDLGGTRLSYSDFKLATFLAEDAIKTAAADLIGDDLNYADLSGSKLTANPFANEVTIDFSGVNLTNDDLGFLKLHYALIKYPISAPKYINFTETNFNDIDLTDTILTGELKADIVTVLKPPAPPSLPAAPRFPIEMLKKRPVDDKEMLSWPIACN